MQGYAVVVHAIEPAAWAPVPAVLPGAVLAVRPGGGRDRGRGVAGPPPPRSAEDLVRGRRGRAAHHRGVAPAPRCMGGRPYPARIWPGLVPMAAVAGFAAAGLAARAGCGCQEHKEQASGAGTAAALAIHRFLEGAAIALAGSAAVALALAAHAFGEGLATGALLGSRPRRRVTG